MAEGVACKSVITTCLKSYVKNVLQKRENNSLESRYYYNNAHKTCMTTQPFCLALTVLRNSPKNYICLDSELLQSTVVGQHE